METRYHDLAIYRQKSSTVYSNSNPTPTVHKSSPFLSAQQVKGFIKLADHLWASMLTIAAQCILWENVYQTGRAFAGIGANYICSVHFME